jgi:protein dithiol oxidoreductase (disulfide-forming)
VKTRRITLAYLLFGLVLMPLTGWAEYTEGVEYLKVQGQPAETGGKIEVREFFWYGCSHCYRLEPTLTQWRKKRKTMSPKVGFVRTPAILGKHWTVHAQAYFAFEALGVNEKMDGAMFKAIHEQSLPLDDEASLTSFVTKQGIDEKRFSDAFRSFSMENSLKRAVDLQQHYGISSVPTLVVDGRYITSPALARGEEEAMEVLDFLIDKAAKERKKNSSKR